MDAKINSYGDLVVKRAGDWKEQMCPEDNEKRCGDWCPRFSEEDVSACPPEKEYLAVIVGCAMHWTHYRIIEDYRVAKA